MNSQGAFNSKFKRATLNSFQWDKEPSDGEKVFEVSEIPLLEAVWKTDSAEWLLFPQKSIKSKRQGSDADNNRPDSPSINRKSNKIIIKNEILFHRNKIDLNGEIRFICSSKNGTEIGIVWFVRVGSSLRFFSDSRTKKKSIIEKPIFIQFYQSSRKR